MEGRIQIFGYLSEADREKGTNVAMIAEASDIESFDRVAFGATGHLQKYIGPNDEELEWDGVYRYFKQLSILKRTLRDGDYDF
jgi:hypothetical protein